jgi:dephospho-CoA kinase
MQRERFDRETVLARMNKQIDEELKRRLCDRVIMNDEQQSLLQQVLKLHEELLTLSKNGSV